MDYLYGVLSGHFNDGIRINGPFDTANAALRYGEEVAAHNGPHWQVVHLHPVSPPSSDLAKIRSALDLLLTAADIVDIAGWSSDEDRRRKAISALTDAAETARDMLRETRRPACPEVK